MLSTKRVTNSVQVGVRRAGGRASDGKPQPRLLNLLDLDAELGADLDADRLALARRQVVVYAMTVPRGPWAQPRWPAPLRLGAGLLMLDGMVLRRVRVSGRSGAELLTSGDVLRPWQREGVFASVSRQAEWTVLERAHMALLDVDFMRRIAPFPEIAGQLFSRSLRRSRHLALNMAIIHQPRVETRLHMLLWHLGDRWGRVQSDGVLVPVRLTHSVLAELVAARRPTVSAALGSLERQGLIRRVSEGWLLLGSPPCDIEELVDTSGV